MKRLLATTLILATTNATASTAQHSHSALGELAARALEGRAQSQGLSDIQVEVFPLDGCKSPEMRGASARIKRS